MLGLSRASKGPTDPVPASRSNCTRATRRAGDIAVTGGEWTEEVSQGGGEGDGVGVANPLDWGGEREKQGIGDQPEKVGF